jgi:hypothetical protein
MPALPKNIDLDLDGVSAWNLLLAAEDAALKKDASPIKSLDEVIGVRVLGFFLLDFYTHSNVHRIGLIPYKCILREITLCFDSLRYQHPTMKLNSRRFSTWASDITSIFWAYVSNLN